MAVLPQNIVTEPILEKRERRTVKVPLYLTPTLNRRWRNFCEKYRLSVNEGAILAMESYLKAVEATEVKQ